LGHQSKIADLKSRICIPPENNKIASHKIALGLTEFMNGDIILRIAMINSRRAVKMSRSKKSKSKTGKKSRTSSSKTKNASSSQKKRIWKHQGR